LQAEHVAKILLSHAHQTPAGWRRRPIDRSMLPSSGDASGLFDASVSTGFTGDLDSDANDKDGPD